jgi:hypothetical protein
LNTAIILHLLDQNARLVVSQERETKKTREERGHRSHRQQHLDLVPACALRSRRCAPQDIEAVCCLLRLASVALLEI